MSLDRRGGERGRGATHCYELSLGSDKSSSMSRSDAGTYDVIQAEIQHAKRQELNTLSNGNVSSSGHDTDNESRGGGRVSKIAVIVLDTSF